MTTDILSPEKNFHTTITVNATADEAYDKISRVNEWWAKDFSGNASKLKDEFTVQFGDTFVDFKLTEAIPGQKVIWLVTGCNLHWQKNKTEWNGTKVVFEITPQTDGVTIAMTHIGLTPALESYENCCEGWTEHVTESLYNLITTGKGDPQ